METVYLAHPLSADQARALGLTGPALHAYPVGAAIYVTVGQKYVLAAAGYLLVGGSETPAPIPEDISGYVRVDVEQAYTSAQQERGRKNLGLTGIDGSVGGLDSEAVLDVVGGAVRGTGLVDVVFSDTSETITVGTTATKNATDAALRDRGTHTGVQTASSISDFTEAAQDAIAQMFAAGSHVGIQFAYDDAGNRIGATVTAGGSTGGTFDAEAAQDALGTIMVGVGAVTVSYNDAANSLTISTTATQNSTDAALRDRALHTGVQPVSSISGLGALIDTREPLLPSGTAAQYIAANKTIQNFNPWTVGLGNLTNTVKAELAHKHTAADVTDFVEAAQDAVAQMFAAGTSVGIEFTYDDAGNRIGAVVSGGGGGGSGGLDIEGAQDAIGGLIVGLGAISVVYNDAANTLSISTTATANSTDAALRARSSHTGSQDISTVNNLRAELDALEPAFAPGTTGQYLRGDKTWQSLNIYSVGLGNITNTVKAEAVHVHDSGDVTDFEEAAQDASAKALVNGAHAGISFAYDDASGKINATVTGGGGGTAGGGTGIGLNLFRGPVAPSTAYAAGDVFIYRGQRCVASVDFVTGAAANNAAFVPSARFIPMSPAAEFYAADWGVVGDGTNDQLAKIAACLAYVSAALGGGTVVLPGGLIMISDAIDLPNGVRLRGQGIGAFGTVVKLLPGSDSNGINFHTSTGSGNANAFWGGIEDMQIHGNRWSQGLTTFNHGINIVMNPASTAQSGDPDFDPAHHFKNLILKNWSGHGFFHLGRSDVYLTSIHSKDNFGAGFYLSFDTRVVGCTAGFNGVCGFWYQGSSTQTVGTKSYNNGKHTFWTSGAAYGVGTYVMYNGALYRAATAITTADTTVPGTNTAKYVNVWADAPWGSGFAVRGGHLKELVFAGCDAQQNSGSGLDFRYSSVVFQGTVTQPNFDNVGTTGAVMSTNPRSYASVHLDQVHECIIDVLTNGTNASTPHLRAIGSMVNSDIRLVGDPASLFQSADTISLAAGGSSLVFNGVSKTRAALASMPAGMICQFPTDGTSVTSATAARPATPAGVPVWWFCAQSLAPAGPTNKLPGDRVIYVG